MLPSACSRLPRLARLLAVSCLGTGSALVLGWSLLSLRPPLSPLTASRTLERVWRFSPDPVLRREASLLLLARETGSDPHQAGRLLSHQAWGRDPLAALVLKLDARTAEQLHRRQRAERLWNDLLRRFPDRAASADALYSLGRQQPWRRAQLLHRFPSHPAALAAALEAGPAPLSRRQGVLHLARWGPRWPGAQDRLKQACSDPQASWTPAERGELASALAELGDSEKAMACLRPGGSLSPGAELALGRSLLRSAPPRTTLAAARLLSLVRQQPHGPEAEEAVRLLAAAEGPEVAEALRQLPTSWQDSAPLAARRALADGDDSTALAVLRRWPADPASWDLQWERSRQRLLQGRWADALRLLQALDATTLPPPLAARQRFWGGYALQQQGRHQDATRIWRQLRRDHPGGYYGWRAAVRLGQQQLIGLAPVGAPPSNLGAPAAPQTWWPLHSGDAALDRLWRLDQATEAWEVWRNRRGPQRPRESRELLLEARLRQGVGDDWTALAQLDQALLSLPPRQCSLATELERSSHPIRFAAAFRQAARDRGLSESLLLGLTKQESRFTPAVESAAGAVGLMQLMPATAAELAGRPISAAELRQPGGNLELGSLYLQRLLLQWQGDPLRAVASYNAGPGAVQRWITPQLQQEPERWVEAIPYPETRLYVKKVLGNAWSYQQGALPSC
jgi:soluble lytic murein transglycosylase